MFINSLEIFWLNLMLPKKYNIKVGHVEYQNFYSIYFIDNQPLLIIKLDLIGYIQGPK